jgi:hypothetical protein
MGNFSDKPSPMPNTNVKFVQCKSGRWLAYYYHRKDIIAMGHTARQALINLIKKYRILRKHEAA